MNKKELQRRGKGLLALMLAFIMMFGTSMTVLAATHTLKAENDIGLSTGQKLRGGDTLEAIVAGGSGGLNVYINGNKQTSSEAGVGKKTCTLPAGSDYKVISYAKAEEYHPITDELLGWNYTVELESIPIAPSGGSTASPEAPQTETGNGGGQPHVHSFSWVTTREATETQDGLDEYKCACGVVDTQVTVPASQVVVKGFYQAIRNAAPNSQITYDTKDLCTMSDKMVACLAERTDVTVEITFIYQKTPYRMTIPAGSDYSALLADEDMFYGYFCFANQIGAQIEPVS